MDDQKLTFKQKQEAAYREAVSMAETERQRRRQASDLECRNLAQRYPVWFIIFSARRGYTTPEQLAMVWEHFQTVIKWGIEKQCKCLPVKETYWHFRKERTICPNLRTQTFFQDLSKELRGRGYIVDPIGPGAQIITPDLAKLLGLIPSNV